MSSVLIEDYQKLKDAELASALRKRNLIPPFNEEGKLLRNEAIAILKDYDKIQVNQEERVWVVFQESNNPSAGPYVFASINDKNFQAPYNKKVCIPKYFLTECIDKAVTTTYTQVNQSDGSFTTVPHSVPVYPYTIIGPASDEDVIEALDKAKK